MTPRLLKGGLVLIDPETAKVLRVIALQYNPDSLTRTLQIQGAGEGGFHRAAHGRGVGQCAPLDPPEHILASDPPLAGRH